MRSTHSIHNFLVVVLTSNALSGGVQGTVALFQYVKKIADGLSSISVGPHLSVYHAMQSKAWALADRRRFVANIRSYLLSAFPLLMLVSAAFAVCAWIALCVTGARGDRFGYTAFAILLVLLAWQTLISVETIAVGVPVMAKKTSVVLVVNGVFVANFYLVIHHVLVAPYTGLAVAVACIACQGVSTVMFTLVAVRLTRIKFGR
jgi:hypothetical protein